MKPQKLALGKLATIRAGYQFRGRVTGVPSGNVRVIQIKDIDDSTNELDTNELVAVQVESPDRYSVGKGDILFLSRGRRLMATEVRDPLDGVIATSYYFILTANPDFVVPGYLAWALNQRRFQHHLSVITNTTTIPWVSRTDFEELQIEVPPLEAQRKIVDLLALHKTQERLALELIDKRKQLITAACRQLAAGDNRGAN